MIFSCQKVKNPTAICGKLYKILLNKKITHIMLVKLIPASVNVAINGLTEKTTDSLLPVIDKIFADVREDEITVFLAILFINIGN
jgi:hypothetical protein